MKRDHGFLFGAAILFVIMIFMFWRIEITDPRVVAPCIYVLISSIAFGMFLGIWTMMGFKK